VPILPDQPQPPQTPEPPGQSALELASALYLQSQIPSAVSTSTSGTWYGADVASASSIAATGNFFTVTGTVTVNNLSVGSFNRVTIKFSGVLTITHAAGGAGQFHLAGAVNKVTAVNDVLEFVTDGTDWWQVP
jgi:hypothetical protein